MSKFMQGYYPFGADGYKPVFVLAIYQQYMMLKRADVKGAVMPFIGKTESFKMEQL